MYEQVTAGAEAMATAAAAAAAASAAASGGHHCALVSPALLLLSFLCSRSLSPALAFVARRLACDGGLSAFVSGAGVKAEKKAVAEDAVVVALSSSGKDAADAGVVVSPATGARLPPIKLPTLSPRECMNDRFSSPLLGLCRTSHPPTLLLMTLACFTGRRRCAVEPLVWIQFMRFARRAESIEASRKVFLSARKFGAVCYQVRALSSPGPLCCYSIVFVIPWLRVAAQSYVEAATMEWQQNKAENSACPRFDWSSCSRVGLSGCSCCQAVRVWSERVHERARIRHQVKQKETRAVCSRCLHVTAPLRFVATATWTSCKRPTTRAICARCSSACLPWCVPPCVRPCIRLFRVAPCVPVWRLCLRELACRR